MHSGGLPLSKCHMVGISMRAYFSRRGVAENAMRLNSMIINEDLPDTLLEGKDKRQDKL
jgi:hypothetical protein